MEINKIGGTNTPHIKSQFDGAAAGSKKTLKGAGGDVQVTVAKNQIPVDWSNWAFEIGADPKKYPSISKAIDAKDGPAVNNPKPTC